MSISDYDLPNITSPGGLTDTIQRLTNASDNIRSSIMDKMYLIDATRLDSDGYDEFAADVYAIPTKHNIRHVKGACVTSMSTIKNAKWERIWTSSASIDGSDVWTNGNEMFYSSNGTNLIFKESVSVDGWVAKTWTGLTNFSGQYVWTDNEETVYYSDGTVNYVLSNNTWSPIKWTGTFQNIIGLDVWTDGIYLYYSNGTNQYVLDKSMSSWVPKTWSGLTNFNGRRVWTDGTKIYHSYGTNQYVLNGSTWSTKTWTGLTDFSGYNIWTDGYDIYMSNGSSQYVLSGSTWIAKTWPGLSSFSGQYIWSDGLHVFFSHGTNTYLLINVTPPTTVPRTKRTV